MKFTTTPNEIALEFDINGQIYNLNMPIVPNVGDKIQFQDSAPEELKKLQSEESFIIKERIFCLDDNNENLSCILFYTDITVSNNITIKGHKSISSEEYQKALTIVEAYRKENELNSEKEPKIGDFVECVYLHDFYSKNKLFTIGLKYEILYADVPMIYIKDNFGKKRKFRYYNKMFRVC